MSQNHERGAVLCAQDLSPRIEEVGQMALRTCRELYSSGFPDFEGGSVRKLGYNNERHGFIMGRDADRLLGYLGFNKYERQLGRITAYAHDRDQLNGRGIDENKSAEWAEEELFNAGVPAEEAELSGLVIQGTFPLSIQKGINKGVIIDQMVNYLKFRSARHELRAKATVAADLSEYLTPFGPYSAHRLYIQRCELNATETPPMNDFAEFLRKQLVMQTEYNYPLEEADAMFATHRRQVCNYTEFMYQRARDGKLEDWKQVTDWDLRFMNDPDISFSRLN